jgi:hypothetical protein
MKLIIPLLMAILPAAFAQSQSQGVPSVVIPKTTAVLVF